MHGDINFLVAYFAIFCAMVLENFDADKVGPEESESIMKILKQRRKLHLKIAEKDTKEVSEILREFDDSELNFFFNGHNESTFMSIYALSFLSEKEIKFWGKCEP